MTSRERVLTAMGRHQPDRPPFDLSFGSPDDVRREVRSRIETVGAGGGLFLAPTQIIEPEVPFENIVAFVETVRGDGTS